MSSFFTRFAVPLGAAAFAITFTNAPTLLWARTGPVDSNNKPFVFPDFVKKPNNEPLFSRAFDPADYNTFQL
ncbi:hypothetical protein BCR33DRAFT_792453 [Rhizoclosmatium globosum]|uniref:Uncharacterized protein n=1 Tax=Rhizoclosmatium globosum TaxID=329046 RepID=A0A1Y2B7Y5_9FUNG|nr:hypothetical protein BCR33DRAFT_792453 [Rhizoclosmatium globosum]|eukprot:ORY30948.1 hypothetical protein BCR33DRAFT_792453 [Rhizoclosmatium globosum]